jgi:hypothetical protein
MNFSLLVHACKTSCIDFVVVLEAFKFHRSYYYLLASSIKYFLHVLHVNVQYTLLLLLHLLPCVCA